MIIKRPRILKKIGNEVWREVPESNNRYHVSNYGRVKSFAYNKKSGLILKTHLIKGYKTVHLNLDKKSQTCYLHRLVAEIWISKPSVDNVFVAHIDGNKINNHVSNLSWKTKETLVDHHRELRQKQNFAKPLSYVNNSKLKERDVMLLKSMLQRGVTQSSIAKMFCISEMQVTRIKRGVNWGYINPD
jgi:hypothetical protein